MLLWFALGFLALGVALTLAHRRKRRADGPVSLPISDGSQYVPPAPAATPTPDFRYYPGVPKGYAGYTDHVAMTHELNAALLGLSPDLQFALAGFARGFLVGIMTRASESEHGLLFRPANPSDEDQERLGWIAHLQKKGTDNAGPSTRNMSEVLYSVVQDLRSTGPYRHGYWDKVRGGAKESLAGSGISPEQLAELVDRMEQEQRRGEQLATGASQLPA